MSDSLTTTVERTGTLGISSNDCADSGKAVRSMELLGSPIQLLSLGAGVQSSCVSLMAAHGLITPMPVAAIFADTQAEPASVYVWLDWLEKQLPYPVIRVTKGNLTETALTIRTKRDGSGTWAKTVIPAYVKNADGTRGIIQRQCTYDYKMLPLIRAAKRLAGKDRIKAWAHYQKTVAAARNPAPPPIIQWIGISLDEVVRMKPSRDKLISHRWPLVELGMKRHDCLRWLEKNGYPKPPRSACKYCPYHSDAEWRRLRDEEPAEFEQACDFDDAYRLVKQKTDNMKGLPYLHNSLIPLRDVDFSTDTDNGQQIMFGNECEGMCGV